MAEASPADIRRAAMDMLARRDHSMAELCHKLARKFSSSGGQIGEEIHKLHREGLQSDRRMAESFIRSRVQRGQGPLKIRGELKARGIDDEDYQIALDSLTVDWFEEIRKVAEKRFGPSPPTDLREKAKRMRFLQQRGFSFDHINSLL